MTLMQKDEIKTKHINNMPHHGVLKEDSLTTKLRVLFDASAQTTSGTSLNDIQMIGLVLQSNLLSIIMRFRTQQFIVGADIAKMYRQALVEPSQRHLQCILWQESPDAFLQAYQLNTVKRKIRKLRKQYVKTSTWMIYLQALIQKKK